MTSPTAQLISPTLPGVSVYLVQGLGSAKEHHRQTLRQTLWKTWSSTHPQGAVSEEGLLDLQQRPPSFMSVSHSSQHSAFGWAMEGSRFGIDLEDLSRIQTSILQRVCKPAELQACPETLWLWSAKEAAFKAFSDEINVISSVEILNWQKIDSQFWSYDVRIQNKTYSSGRLCLILGHSLAFFTAPP